MSNPLSAYPLSKIDGLGAHAQAKLKAQGIRTMAALLDNASTPKGRKLLATKTGLSEQQLLAWANIAVLELSRIVFFTSLEASLAKSVSAIRLIATLLFSLVFVGLALVELRLGLD